MSAERGHIADLIAGLCALALVAALVVVAVLHTAHMTPSTRDVPDVTIEDHQPTPFTPRSLHG